jgi:hypothetical protein
MSKCARLAIVIVTLCQVAGPAVAQTSPRVVDPAVLLREFRREASEGGQGSATSLVSQMMVHGDQFRPTDVQQVLDELERLVLTGESSEVRGQAAWAFALAGAEGVHQPRRDIVPRCARLYSQSSDPWVKETLISVMRRQVDRPAAIRFLSDVITDPGPAISDDSPGRYAVIALAAMGEDGQAELRRLDQEAQIADKSARKQLDAVAKSSYRNR